MKNASKFLALVFSVSIFATSCSNYGKKVTFEGTKGEVYYKGDGVTEADAKKLGDYLKTIDYISNTKESSYQLTKSGDTYSVKLVINRAVYDTAKTMDNSFKALGVLISKHVFDNKKVDIILTNDVFESFKTLVFDESYAKSLEADDENDFGKDVLINGTKGEVYIKGEGVTEADAQKLGQQLRKITFLNDTTQASVQLQKNDDGYLVRFVYDKHFYETTPDIVKNFNIIRNSLSTDVFGGKSVDIRLANEKMQDFATIPMN